jgi:hypothetical protein
MGFTYAEFDTTIVNVVADLKTKILVSSDYSNPSGQVLKATTPLGATIAVDLVGGGAVDTQALRPTFWRLWSGSGTDALAGRFLYWKRSAGGTTANPLHCKVAAGPTLLYIEIEGPRFNEAGADSVSYGSLRQCLCVAQLTPYFAGDAVPAVAVLGSTATSLFNSPISSDPRSMVCNVSMNAANTAPWVTAFALTLAQPASQQIGGWQTPLMASGDGNAYLAPWVIFEQLAGIRGRLSDVFYAGWYGANLVNAGDTPAVLQPSDVVSYGGNSYRMCAPYKSDGSNSGYSGGSFGMPYNLSPATNQHSPMVAVRSL